MGEATTTNERHATVNDPERERRDFVKQVRQENEADFGPSARRSVETMLSAGHPHPWAYVYELAQNAIDAGARRISWRTENGSLLFQHDGDVALNASAVRGLSSLGASTKGQDAIGFMGVGFKSVFARFRTARVSGFGWRIRFDIGVREGAFGATVADWFDALRPHWDPEPIEPEKAFTTAFLLTRAVAPTIRLDEDLRRLASPDDPTPLSVLALRGLEQMRIDDVIWDLSVGGGVVEVRRAPDGFSRRWRFFRSRYRPDDAAMRRFLEVRRELTYHEARGAERPKRSVVALVPLAEDGLPNPPAQGRVYATLPTRVRIPFGFHLQGDWLVNLDRQNLRTITGDPWQEAIVRQVPTLVREVLLWLKEESESARSRGYRILSDPTRIEGEMSDVLGTLRSHFICLLRDLEIIPVLGPETRRFSTPQEMVRLPGRFLAEFGKRPAWRPDLLFDRELMDEGLLGGRAVRFANWLGWGRDIEPDSVEWTVTLPLWWSNVDENTAALFALWSCVSEREWHHAPVVPTDAYGWLPANDTCWLNEEPPSDKEPSGAVIAEALAPLLPAPDQRLPRRVRALVNRDRTSHPGVTWLQARHREMRLADIVRRGCANAGDGNAFPLVELMDWAVARGANRQDLVPQVQTEDGAYEPAAALLADPLVPGGDDRRRLFPRIPALVEDYALIDDQQAAVRFIEGLGVRGDATLTEQHNPVGYDEQAVAELLGIDVARLEPATLAGGWTVVDYDLPFTAQAVPHDALQKWLSREHTLLAHKGRLKARSSYHGPKTTDGELPSKWVKALEQVPWILCVDGQRRKPSDLLLHADPDYEDAPLADIDPDLANRLEQEGVRFGTDVSRSPVLRRLEKQGSSNLPDDDLAALLEEALAEIEAGTVTREELTSALRSVELRGVPFDRVVREVGRPRSDLGGWVVALSTVETRLAAAVDRIERDLPKTTTGKQALGYLTDLWRRRPDSVDQIRPHIASAYRYVLEDLERDQLHRGAWRDAKIAARLYGRGRWHAIGDSLVVDDVRSPFIRQLLTPGRVAVTAAYLGDSPGQIRLVATELGIARLSTKIKVSAGPELPKPTWMVNLDRLAAALATLEGRQRLRRITSREHLGLQVEGVSHNYNVSAYLVDDELMVTGTPEIFGTEAAEQLVEHFQLGQRGNSIPRLTAALASLGEDHRFSENLNMLATSLGVSVPDPLPRGPEADAGETMSPGHVDLEKAGTTGAVPQSGAERSDPRRDIVPTDPIVDSGETASAPRPPAADQIAIVVSRGSGPPSTKPREGSAPVKPMKAPAPPKDDTKARAAVVKYETQHNRRATEGSPGQPGYDVLSEDLAGATKRWRRIEVKGVKGDFREPASVLLTARQVQDALHHDEGDVEYWLYVVDRTETDHPRVFPIPWTRNRSHLRYGFRADMWAQYAEKGP